MPVQTVAAARPCRPGSVVSIVTMTSGSEQTNDDEREEVGEHLADVNDGCGCAEIWEYLSDERDES